MEKEERKENVDKNAAENLQIKHLSEDLVLGYRRKIELINKENIYEQLKSQWVQHLFNSITLEVGVKIRLIQQLTERIGFLSRNPVWDNRYANMKKHGNIEDKKKVCYELSEQIKSEIKMLTTTLAYLSNEQNDKTSAIVKLLQQMVEIFKNEQAHLEGLLTKIDRQIAKRDTKSKVNKLIQVFKYHINSVGNPLPLLHHRLGANAKLNCILKKRMAKVGWHQLPSFWAQVGKKA